MARERAGFLETTEVAAQRSIAEICEVLVRAGAREISTTYENGEPAGVRWSMLLYARVVWFQMPVKVEPVFKKLRAKAANGRRGWDAAKLRDRARRVAWRQLLMWVKVQTAMIELEQVEFGQVFLPYSMDSSGRTMWEVVFESQFKQLPAPSAGGGDHA